MLIVAQALAESKMEGVQVQSGEASAGPLPSLLTEDGKTLFTPLAIYSYLTNEDALALLKLQGDALIDSLINFVKTRNLEDVPKDEVAAELSSYGKARMGAVCKLLKNDTGLWKSIVEKNSQLALWFEAFEAQVDRAVRLLPAGINLTGIRQRKLLKENIELHYDMNKKKLPKKGEPNILITSALPYVNNVPHLGNIIGAVLSADVFARYCRLREYNVIYICGTDEYGTATETKALEEGTSCEAVCSKYFKQHAAIYDWFQINFDYFGRTSTPVHTKITHSVFHSLYNNGFFFEQGLEQTFCEKCDRFLADRYVEGTCPLCAFPDARGDQCDGCGKLMNPIELKESKCKLCKTRPIVKSSQHLFLDLTKLQEQTAKFVDESSETGAWSGNSAAIAKGWLHDGLKARCMTRDLKWGCPVPLKGMEDKVFYVWFDAPIGYLSITANYCGPETDDWELWWKNPKDVQLYQFMGKDNVPFHTIIFPATLLGTQEPYTLLHHINTTEYLNYENGKFSKSRCTGVFGNDARDCGIPPAMWRYYLLSTRPESSDSVFSWDDFASKINSELIANLGNFINRTTKFVHSKLNAVVPQAGDLNNVDRVFIDKVNEELREYEGHMEAVRLKAALKSVMAISSLGNGYLSESKLDGKLLTNQPERCHTVLSLGLNLCYLIAILVEPFLPSVCGDVLSILNAPMTGIPGGFEVLLGAGHELNAPFHLFQPLDLKFVSELRLKYAGKQQ